MTRLERIEEEVAKLSPDELEHFRAWFATFDAELWDREIEHDADSGILDRFADQAIAEHAAGRTKPV